MKANTGSEAVAMAIEFFVLRRWGDHSTAAARFNAEDTSLAAQSQLIA
jgi:hypothetical protein